jgi:hypothetical protein
MKRLAVIAAVLALAACKAKENAPATTADTTAAPAMAPAPAADTGMKADTGMMKMDTAKKDTSKKM